MGKTLRYLKTYRGLLDEFDRVQKEKEAAETEGNEMLSRLFALDMARIRERLKVNPCDICHYRDMNLAPNLCEYWDQCTSTVTLKRYWDEGDWVMAEFALAFKLDRKQTN